MNFGLFEAQELDQNCLKSCAKDYIEGQTQGVMKPVEMLLFISVGSDPFCSFSTSSALTGRTLILASRADEI